MKKSMVLWARQYSKRLLAFLLIGWAIGAVVGGAYEFIRLVAAPETASMDAYYVYLAAPITCGIPSYIIPNIYLNREKVKQGYDPDYDSRFMNDEDMVGEGIGEPPSELSMEGGIQNEV